MRLAARMAPLTRRADRDLRTVPAAPRVFGRLLAAYVLNELAWSVGTLALALLVYRRTGTAIGSTGFFLCSQVVPALLSPALVAKLDRVAPRPVLPALYGLEGSCSGCWRG